MGEFNSVQALTSIVFTGARARTSNAQHPTPNVEGKAEFRPAASGWPSALLSQALSLVRSWHFQKH